MDLMLCQQFLPIMYCIDEVLNGILDTRRPEGSDAASTAGVLSRGLLTRNASKAILEESRAGQGTDVLIRALLP